MKFKFQSFFDVSTSATSMQVLQFSVGGSEVLNRCRHLFGAYKYFKLGKISVKMVPASTLPVDPLQLSYSEDDPQSVDPRDQMNPGLVRITNGEDIFTDVSSLSDEAQIGIYNTMMLDPRWSKFMLQSGFRRSAYPLFWQIGQLHQDLYPGSTINFPLTESTDYYGKTVASHGYKSGTGDTNALAGARSDEGSSARGLFQVGHRGRIGFLPTDMYQEIPIAGSGDRYKAMGSTNSVPEVSVITCVLPKAYKTLYFYRIFVTEEVIFSGLRSAPYMFDNTHQYLGLDNFIISRIDVPYPPGSAITTNYLDKNDGGNLP